MLAMWRDNLDRLPMESAWPTILSVVVAAALSVVLLRPLMGSMVRAGLASGVLALYCFHATAIIASAGLSRTAGIAAHVLAILCVIMLARHIPRERVRLASFSGKVNLVGLIMLAVTAIPILASLGSAAPARAEAARAFAPLPARASPNSPDVWHILFDRYAGLSTFSSAYGYDNRPFVEALRARGFAVHDEAYANYQRTAHSLASTLNGTLLDGVGTAMAKRPSDWVPIYRGMRESASLRTFEAMGYRTIFAGSWWEPTRFSSLADESIEVRAVPQLARLAIDRSAVGFWTSEMSLPWLDGRKDQCYRANEKFRRLRALARSPVRKQVFAHFLVPHPPFVLNADGSCRSYEEAKKASRRDNYIAQVEFANREALALIDAILAGPRQAVIVLHSDEGPWPAPYVGDEHGLGTDPVAVPWARLTPRQLRDKMGILLAVRGPDGVPRNMPASPVQIYPVILRDYFAAPKLPMPPSQHFIFEGDDALYRFIPVGDKLRR